MTQAQKKKKKKIWVVAFKTYWIFNSATDLEPQMKPFNSLWSTRLGKNTVPNYSSQKAESKRHIKRDQKKERKKKQREEWIETVQTVSLTHTGQHGAVHHTVYMLRDLCWLQLTVKFPLGFRRRAVRKVITALVPASLLQFQVESFFQNMEK